MTNDNTQTTLYLRSFDGDYYLSLWDGEGHTEDFEGEARYLRVKDIPCGKDMIPAEETGIFRRKPSYWADANAAQKSAESEGYKVISRLKP